MVEQPVYTGKVVGSSPTPRTMPNEGFPNQPTKVFKRENQSITETFEGRAKFIHEIGEQLERETKADIEVGGESLSIDYREISVASLENKDGDVVVLLPGFGSGWEGISELGFSLACEGRKVIMPSLPGYGNSDDPSKNYFNKDNFDNEAEVINQLLDKVALNPGARFHLIGHSMGSEIMATFAEKYPDRVSSLVLLNPAGIEEKENAAALFARFLGSGAQTNIEYASRLKASGETDYEDRLKKYIPKTKSPFAVNRLAQRMAEGSRVSRGHLLEKIRNTECPITYISGELEVVYPPGHESEADSQLARIIKAVGDEERIEKSVMAGLRHNTTIAPDEITAANINHYLEVAEKKQIGKKESL